MTGILTRPAGVRGVASRAARPGLVLAVVLTAQFMAVLDASVVNVAVPSIQATLHASGASLQLVVAGYTITYAVLMVTGARLGDIIGHRRVFLAGLAVFTLASLGCGAAASAGALIALRFAQGAGAALLIPQVLSLIQRTRTGPARSRAMSRYSAVLAGGTVAGQVAGGLLISADIAGSGWRPVFWVNVPVGLALLVAGLRVLPRGKGEPGRNLDLPGLALLTPAVLALVLPLVLGQPEHWPVRGWLMLAATVPLTGLFALAERRVSRRGGTPLIPGQVLALPGVTVAIVALLAAMTVFGGFFFTLALHLQDGLGDSALAAGLTFAPAAATFGLVSLNWRRVPARRHGALIITGFGTTATSIAGLALLLRSGGTGGAWIYLLAAATGAGMAASFTPLMTRVLLQVPVPLAADATGVVVTINQLGIVVGVAAFGTLYLNRAGQLASHGALAFRHASAHGVAVTFLAIAGLAVAGALLAARHLAQTRHR